MRLCLVTRAYSQDRRYRRLESRGQPGARSTSVPEPGRRRPGDLLSYGTESACPLAASRELRQQPQGNEWRTPDGPPVVGVVSGWWSRNIRCRPGQAKRDPGLITPESL